MSINSTSPLLDFEKVGFGYERHRVLEGVTFAVHPGEHLALIGANGSGKSTVLSLAAGILTPHAGRVVRTTPRLAFVVQRSAVSDRLPLTVLDTVSMGLWGELGLWRRPSRGDRATVDALLERLGIAHLATRQLGSLSGGQRQRALLGQALASRPDILLLDEPTTGLDADALEVIHSVIQEELQRGAAVLHATHYPAAAAEAHAVLDLSRQTLPATP